MRDEEKQLLVEQKEQMRQESWFYGKSLQALQESGTPLSYDSPIGETKRHILATVASAPVFTFPMPILIACMAFLTKGP